VRRLEEHHQTGLLTLTLSKAKKARFSVVPIFLILHHFYLILSHKQEAPDINARGFVLGECDRLFSSQYSMIFGMGCGLQYFMVCI
jgi:hypothetical protein